MSKELLLDDIIKEKASSEKLVLPEELNIKISETINSLPNKRISKVKMKKTVTAAVITLAALTCLGVVFPTYARNVPFLGSAFQFLSGNNKIDREYVEYSSDINVSKTSNNIKVTINNIVFDGVDLSIGYTVESKNEFKKEPAIFAYELKINDQTMTSPANGGGDFIDKHTYVAVDNYHLVNRYLQEENKENISDEGAKIPDNLLIDFNIRTLFDGSKGKWDFKFNVSTDKLKGKIKEAKTSIDLSEIDNSLKINKIIFTPINTALRCTTDNLKKIQAADYMAFDDKGRSLPVKNVSRLYSDDAGKIYWQHTFKNIYEDTKSVTFIPISFTKEYKEIIERSREDYKDHSKEVSLNLDGTTILSQGIFGEYKISKVEFLEDKTLIHYECTKYIPAISHAGFMVKDKSGKIYKLRGVTPIEEGSNKLIAEIEPLSKDKKYILTSLDLEKQFDIREDLKFTVEIK